MTGNTGGPAFPNLTSRDRDTGDYLDRGMTLRDYFAAKALPAVIDAYVKGNGCCIGTDHFFSNVPAHAYRMADAMLAKRSEK